MLLMFFWQEAWMKKQYSVQGKSRFSCHTLLNLQVLLTLTRQTMKAAGVKASHQHSVSVCCCTGVGRSRMQKQAFVKGGGWEDSRSPSRQAAKGFPREPASLEGGNSQTGWDTMGCPARWGHGKVLELFSTNSHNFPVMEKGVPSHWGSGGSLVGFHVMSIHIWNLPLLYPLLLILLLLLSLSYFTAVSIGQFQ